MAARKGDLENSGNAPVVAIHRLMTLEVITVRMGNEITWNMFLWRFLRHALNYVSRQSRMNSMKLSKKNAEASLLEKKVPYLWTELRMNQRLSRKCTS